MLGLGYKTFATDVDNNRRNGCSGLLQAVASTRDIMPKHDKPLSALLLLTLVAASLGGCTAYRPHSAATPSNPAKVTKEQPQIPMSGATMLDLMQAESAIDHGHPDQALPLYTQEAETTRDPAVLQRAIRLAMLTHHHEVSLRLAQLWLQKDPSNIQAMSAEAASLWHLGYYNASVQELEKILHDDPHAIFAELLFSRRPRSATEIQRIESAMQQLLHDLPDNVNARYTYAFWLAHEKKTEAALDVCQSIDRIDPYFVPANLLQTQLLEVLHRDKDAMSYITHALDHTPDSIEMRQNRAALAIRMGDTKKAETDYGVLFKNAPDHPDIALAYALLSIQNHHLDQAHRALNALASIPGHENEAYFYLGQLEVAEGHNHAALINFRAVNAGPNYLAAQQSIASILEKSDHPEQAVKELDSSIQHHPEFELPLNLLKADVLNDLRLFPAAALVLDGVLKHHPEDSDALYARAMVAVQLNDLDLFLKDIHIILKKNPHNPIALNALGYTLADRTDRLKEAQNDIEEALKLSPNDPAIIDSMGWVLYRQGDKAKALQHLAKAWSLDHDDEIGAHYGELLWVTGQKTDAQHIWDEALHMHPNSPYVPATRKRLGIN